ncbi:MAG TPA: glycoside hydrolase family 47 protein, partial [Rhizomicrobium sp.]|nr:glycoside hydrolase family 47 protein [Rhizomicrobium sp.]
MISGIHRRGLLEALAVAPAAASFAFPARSAANRKALAEDVRAQMRWAWLCYRRCCFGADQIKPVSGRGEPFFFPKGPSLGLTIVEALDTLYVMGLDRQIVEGLRWLYDRLDFDVDGEVQVFETAIRMVGGLLSGWRGTGEKRLLALAKDLADRLA